MWKQDPKKKEQYDKMQKDIAGDMLLQRPSFGKQSQGFPKKTFTDQITDDTGCRINEISNGMNGRDGRRVLKW